jgi:photosystem II stability/assembly factor-like uncharacterized protein
MKTLQILFVTLTLLPLSVKSQWQAVRYDSTNTFRMVETPTANTALVIGTEPTNLNYFLLRTNDAGATWDSITISTNGDTLLLSEMNFMDEENGFIGGTKNGKQFLQKTNDNGTSWQEITPNPSSDEAIKSVSFIDSENGYAIDETYEGNVLYKTMNGGASWEFDTVNFTISDLHFFDSNTAIASGYNKWGVQGVVMKTTDGGQNWDTLLAVEDRDLFMNKLEKIDVVNSNIFTTNHGNTKKLYQTLDGGNTWDTLVVSVANYPSDFDFTTADTGHILTYSGEIFSTVDGGQNWILEYATEWGLYGPSVTLYSCSFIENTGFTVGSNGLIKKYTFSTGTEHINQNSSKNFTLYPNPLSRNKRLVINASELSGLCKIQIQNTHGQVVFQKEVYSNGQITLSDLILTKGMFTVIIQTDKWVNAQNLIITE